MEDATKLLDFFPAPICLISKDAKCLYTNQTWDAEFSSYEDALTVLQRYIHDWPSVLEKVLLGDTEEKKVAPVYIDSKNYKWIEWKVSPYKVNDAKVESVIIYINEITSQVDMRNFSEQSLEIICTASVDGYILSTNSAFSDVIGYTEEEIYAQPFLSFIHPDDVEQTIDTMKVLGNGEAVLAFENRYIAKNNEVRWLQWNAKVDELSNLIYATARDITEQKNTEELLKKNYKLFDALHLLQGEYIEGRDIRNLFEQTLNILLELTESEYGFIGKIVIDEQNGQKIPYLKTYAITNIAWDDATRKFYEQGAPEGLEFRNLETLFGYTIRTGEIVIANDPMHDARSGGLPAGHPPLERYLGMPIYGKSGLVGMVGIANRIEGYNQELVKYLEPFFTAIASIIDAEDSQEKLAVSTEQLKHMAMHDYLTHLPNRAYFDDEFQNYIDLEKQFSLLYIDLDDFKSVNDKYGHPIGDQLLKQFSRRLISSLKDIDFIARLGGDEFAVLLIWEEAIHDLDSILSRIMRNISTQYRLEGYELNCHFSIGVASYPNDGVDKFELTRNADAALYAAKHAGKNQFRIYDDKKAISYKRHNLLAQEIMSPEVHNEFYYVYQPIYNLNSMTVAGGEALLRWNSPSLGTISPVEFIGIAESKGRIINFTEFLINKTQTLIKTLKQEPINSVFISFNVSPLQLMHEGFIDIVCQLQKKLIAIGVQLIIEITETAIMFGIEKIREILLTLKEDNIKLAIDDFGTGSSTLERLKSLPIDILKIDTSFVRDYPHEKNSAAILKSLLSLANNLNLEVIAEGIETKKQLTFLQENGCQFGQGFYLDKPLAESDFLALLKRQK